MSIMMFEATGYIELMINKVAVDRCTEKNVWINGRMRRRLTDYTGYFDTHIQAKEYLMQRCKTDLSHAERRIASAKRDIEIINKKLVRIESL